MAKTKRDGRVSSNLLSGIVGAAIGATAVYFACCRGCIGFGWKLEKVVEKTPGLPTAGRMIYSLGTDLDGDGSSELIERNLSTGLEHSFFSFDYPLPSQPASLNSVNSSGYDANKAVSSKRSPFYLAQLTTTAEEIPPPVPQPAASQQAQPPVPPAAPQPVSKEQLQLVPIQRPQTKDTQPNSFQAGDCSKMPDYTLGPRQGVVYFDLDAVNWLKANRSDLGLRSDYNFISKSVYDSSKKRVEAERAAKK